MCLLVRQNIYMIEQDGKINNIRELYKGINSLRYPVEIRNDKSKKNDRLFLD